MSVSASDIVFYRSANAGSSGGAVSGTAITDNVKNNLFDDILDAERIAGGTRYKKWFITNTHSTDDFEKPVVWISTGPRGMGDAEEAVKQQLQGLDRLCGSPYPSWNVR